MMKRKIRLTESDLRNIVKETINILLNESYGEVRSGYEDSEDDINGLSIFDKDLAQNVKSRYFRELLDNLRKIKNLNNEITTSSYEDVSTVVEFLPLFAERLMVSLQTLNLQSSIMDKVIREIKYIENYFNQGNLQDVKKHSQYLSIYLNALGDVIDDL